MVRTLPYATVTLLTLILLLAAWPPGFSVAVYDRDAILNGQIWRLVTGNLVHLSPEHLCYDSAALGIAGSLIEQRGYRHFGWLCALAAVAVGSTLLLFQPQVSIYAGASGVAMAAVTFLALHGLLEAGWWRWLCTLTLMAVCIKIGCELATGHGFFVHSREFSVCPASHIAGTLSAFIMFISGPFPKRSLECRFNFQ